MKHNFNILFILQLLLLLLFSNVTRCAPPPDPPSVDPRITCETERGSEPAFYGDESASARYDGLFSEDATVPFLDEYIPQGIGTWFNWDEQDRDLLLVTAYHDGQDSLIIGIDPETGETLGQVPIAEGHVSGITTVFDWAFVTGRDTSIRKYRLSQIRDAFKFGASFLSQEGEARDVAYSSFLSSYGDTLFAGQFTRDGRGTMYHYRVHEDGTLDTLDGSWEIPKGSQGLLVTENHFIYSTSLSRDVRGNIYVVKRGETNLDEADLKCFRSPSMGEGITEWNGSAYLLFESGAYEYVEDPNTLHKIKNLHKAKVSELVALV